MINFSAGSFQSGGCSVPPCFNRVVQHFTWKTSRSLTNPRTLESYHIFSRNQPMEMTTKRKLSFFGLSHEHPCSHHFRKRNFNPKHLGFAQSPLCTAALNQNTYSSSTRPRSDTRCRQNVKRKVALVIAYEGSRYHGFQRNAGVTTVSDEIERALHNANAISDENVGSLDKIKWQVAARTDRGVSAAGNLISVKLLFDREELALGSAFRRMTARVNDLLPDHIRVLSIRQITGSFNARASCEARWYEYLIPLSVLEDDISALKDFNAIISKFRGSHFFHNFTIGMDHALPPRTQARRYVTDCKCDITPLTWTSADGSDVQLVRICIRGQSFMLHQIRKMVSLAIMTIQQRVPVDAIERSFSPDTLINVAPAPSIGLFLDCCRFGWYNDRQHRFLAQPLDMTDIDNSRHEFKTNYIIPSIAERFLEGKFLQDYFNTIEAHPVLFD